MTDAMNMEDCERYLKDVKARCKTQGVAFTAIRQSVLGLLYRHPEGLKAYDLLRLIKEERDNATPPTVYRALDFLMEYGLAHKIGRMNLFVACRHHSHAYPSLFLVCPKCNKVSELEAGGVMEKLVACINQAGYCLDSPEVEITAVCPLCVQLGEKETTHG